MNDLSPSPGHGGFDDPTSPAAVAAVQAALQHDEQQRALRGYRVALQAKINAKAPPATILDYYQKRIVGRPQYGPWDSFYPMVEGLMKIGPPPDLLIILGGWLRPPPTTLTGLLPTAADLQKDVWDFGVYFPIRHSATTPGFQDWVRAHPDQFAAAYTDDGWDWDAAARCIPDLVELKRTVHDHLTFLGQQALVFNSTPADPGQAWRDFGRFCQGYNQVQSFLPASCAEYYLLIAPPPSAAPPAAPVSSSTPPKIAP